MQKRSLGRTGYAIAPFAFGGNVFGWTADEATPFLIAATRIDLDADALAALDPASR